MKVTVNYDLSELRDYNPQGPYAGHKYLYLVLQPSELTMVEQMSLANPNIEMLLYPRTQTDAEGNRSIIENYEQAMIKQFNEHTIEGKRGYLMAEKVQVPIPPCIQTYSQNTREHSKGDWIMEGKKPRLKTTVGIASFTVLEDGKEIPLTPESELKSRALAIRKYRIDQQQWFEPEAYGTPAEPDQDFVDVDFEEQQQPQPQPQPQPVVARPNIPIAGTTR